MKTCLYTPLIGLLLLLTSGCQPDRGYTRDEAKTVARITATQVGSALAFADRAGAEQMLSPLAKSEHLNFGIVLDSKRQVFSYYFKPGIASQREAVVAKMLQLLRNDGAEASTGEHGLTAAITPVELGGQNTGYVIVGRVGS